MSKLDPTPTLEQLLRLSVNRVKKDKPHKPLLVLIMLMRLRNEGTESLPFTEVRPVLTSILEALDFPQANVAYPFWLLQNDHVWRVRRDDRPLDPGEIGQVGKGGRVYPDERKMEKVNPSGGFRKPIIEELNDSPWLIDTVADRLLEKYFDSSQHTKIKHLIGYHDVPSRNQLMFSKNVLLAYQSRCSVCNCPQDRLFNNLVELSAAPIVPDSKHANLKARDGISLCNLHGTLFRSGLITFIANGADYTLKASSRCPEIYSDTIGRIYKSSDFDLGGLENKELLLPAAAADRPASALLQMHNESIFLG